MPPKLRDRARKPALPSPMNWRSMLSMISCSERSVGRCGLTAGLTWHQVVRAGLHWSRDVGDAAPWVRDAGLRAHTLMQMLVVSE